MVFLSKNTGRPRGGHSSVDGTLNVGELAFCPLLLVSEGGLGCSASLAPETVFDPCALPSL